MLPLLKEGIVLETSPGISLCGTGDKAVSALHVAAAEPLAPVNPLCSVALLSRLELTA